MNTAPLRFTDFCEWRRQRAWRLFQNGWKQVDIAEALGVSRAAVSQWCATALRIGGKALAARRTRGRSAKLTAAEKRQLPDFLWHGAAAFGFRGDVWTTARVAKIIEREFGIRYHRDHVSRLLREIGWTPPLPITRAFQRDEAAIAQWRREVWPALKKRRGKSVAP